MLHSIGRLIKLIACIGRCLHWFSVAWPYLERFGLFVCDNLLEPLVSAVSDWFG